MAIKFNYVITPVGTELRFSKRMYFIGNVKDDTFVYDPKTDMLHSDNHGISVHYKAISNGMIRHAVEVIKEDYRERRTQYKPD